MTIDRKLGFTFLGTLLLASGTTMLSAQSAAPNLDAAGANAAQSDEAPSAADELALRQSRLADKYERLEQLLLKLAAFEAAENPRRAALIQQALKQSRDRFTLKHLNTIVALLSRTDKNWDKVIRDQATVGNDMKALLDLLLSENRPDRLKSEQARYREYIKELDRILRMQRAARGRTEGGASLDALAQDQDKVADRTEGLAKQIQENEESNKPGDKDNEAGAGQENDQGEETEPKDGEDNKGKEPSPEDSKNEGGDKQQPGDNNQSKNENGSKEGQPSEGQPKEGGQNQQNNGGQDQGRQSEGGQDGEQQQAQNQQQQNEEFPARKRIQAAEEKMRQAQLKLEEAKRKDAVKAQQEAEEELRKAKAELEEILRQLREEEIERTLALLESRFRKMLEMQLKVYEGTLVVAKMPADEPGRGQRAGNLSFDQRKIVAEADRALTLLLEEGSSVAFPEAIGQMRDDMEQVAERLYDEKVDAITQGIQLDIITALEEAIEAFQQAQQDLENQKQQQGQPQMGQPQEQPLVDAIAELKMIKSLQIRVNSRTQRYARLLTDEDDLVGQATDGELLEALGKLAEREERIHRITRDIVLGKNR